MNGYELLSEIYRLLGSSTPEVVREAKRLAEAPAITAILDAIDAAQSARASVQSTAPRVEARRRLPSQRQLPVVLR